MVRILLALVVLACPMLAQDSPEAARARAISELRMYAGKVVMLRKFCRDKAMNFDAAGDLQCVAKPLSWTIDGIVRLRSADVRNGLLWLEGARVYAAYRPETRSFDYLASGEHVKITARLPPGAIDADIINAALGRVLLRADEHYPEETMGGRTVNGEADAAMEKLRDSVARVGGAVKPPKPVDTPDPEYTKEARDAKYQATCLLWAVIGTDGHVRELRIARPAGMGLDEKAIQAVSKWRFSPATKDGKPVAVQVNVEVNFRLYR